MDSSEALNAALDATREQVEEVAPFLFDDFFFKDEDTDDVSVEVHGRVIPFKIKRGASFADFRAAQKNALKVIYKPDGSVLSVSADEGLAQLELLARVLKEWPFKDNGVPVPITRENIDLLDGAVVNAVVQKVQGILTKKVSAQAPLGSPSGEAS